MYSVKRWTGQAWDTSMCSPYKSYKAAMDHVKKYSWHYTKSNPYKIVEVDNFVSIKKTQPRQYNHEGMVVINKVMK